MYRESVAGERRDALDEKVWDTLRELLAVVPEAGESGEAVVEGNHRAERVHRVSDDVAGGDGFITT